MMTRTALLRALACVAAAEYPSNSCTITADYAHEARHAFCSLDKDGTITARAFPRDPYARGAAHYRLMPPAKRGVPHC